MGLDMYLYAKQFGTTKHGSLKEKSLANAIIDEIGARDLIASEDMVFVFGEVNIAYWRKANAVHKFFVNLAGGKDECQKIYVERDDLQELLNRCNEILKNKSVVKAEELLPTQGGFFFGPTDYDEGYFKDLEYTQTRLTEILEKAPESWTFSYQASW